MIPPTTPKKNSNKLGRTTLGPIGQLVREERDREETGGDVAKKADDG